MASSSARHRAESYILSLGLREACRELAETSQERDALRIGVQKIVDALESASPSYLTLAGVKVELTRLLDRTSITGE